MNSISSNHVMYRRMGVGAAATLLDLYLNNQIQLTHQEFDWLCARLVDLLGECRDEVWRLRGDPATDRDTLIDE